MCNSNRDSVGPARIAKVGAVELASSAGVPLIPSAADRRPAIEERHKWDEARNPLPFGNLLVLFGLARRFEPLEELSSIEEAKSWLEVAQFWRSCCAEVIVEQVSSESKKFVGEKVTEYFQGDQ